ncbi:MAG TPA: sugar transferase [Ktedonobacteraceae bacterium]|nr:sugar transferase [Ktedonobacteraceae bacterium]
MLEPDEKPFADYLRDVDSMLVGVSAQQRNEIRRELLAHLEDVAAEQGSSANDAVFQEQVIADLGASQDLGLAFYEVHHGSHEVAKRVFDLCIVIVFLMVLAPLFLLVAVLIKLDSRGPILYQDRRIGRNGRRFALYKFRSMFVECGKLPPERRVTRVGLVLRKTSLDELPQLFNVLKGEMSVVGPRPAAPGDIRLAIPQWRCVLALRPGLTGPEVCGGVARGDVQKQIEASLHYAGKQSLLYDLRLLGRTLGMLVRPRARFR